MNKAERARLYEALSKARAFDRFQETMQNITVNTVNTVWILSKLEELLQEEKVK